MSLKSIKNNIFLYSLSLSNTVNYIFYFPFIILYLLENDNLTKTKYIQIYLFFIIYDLIRNLTANFIRKISKYIGINKLISINLLILVIISILLFLAVFRSFHDKEHLNTLIIFRLIISLVNISPLFTSKIILNIFDRKEMFNKLKYIDFYEKLNNFLIFLSVFFITPDKFPYYFHYSFIYNLYFLILYLIFFKCHDDKNFALFEEKISEKNKSNNNQSSDLSKNLPKKKFNKRIKSKEVLSLGEDNNFSKSGDKRRLGKRKSSAKIINDNVNLEKEGNENYFPDKNNENGDIENNVIVLTTTNNNQGINKDDTNDNNNIQFQKQNIYIVNNAPISSSQRVLQAKMRNNSMIDLKNDIVNLTRKLIFISLIIIPLRFLKYLFLFMLFLKTYSLKNVFSIEVHLLFYCAYFFLSIPVDLLNKTIYSKIIKKKSGKKIILISSFALIVPSISCYIFLSSFNHINSQKNNFLIYILFFVLNIFLKEGLVVVLRIFYTNSLEIGFSKVTLKNMKEISNIFACLLFFGYNISLLFINQGDRFFYKILFYIIYYFLPIFFFILSFIYIAKIS